MSIHPHPRSQHTKQTRISWLVSADTPTPSEGRDSHMVNFWFPCVPSANHAARATRSTGPFSLAHSGGLQPPWRLRRGASAAQARWRRPDPGATGRSGRPVRRRGPGPVPIASSSPSPGPCWRTPLNPNRSRSRRRRRPRIPCGGGCCGRRRVPAGCRRSPSPSAADAAARRSPCRRPWGRGAGRAATSRTGPFPLPCPGRRRRRPRP